MAPKAGKHRRIVPLLVVAVATLVGLAVAELDDTVSGYDRGASGGFNQAFGFSRTKWAAFLKLEAMY